MAGLLATPAAGLDISTGISALGEHIVFWKASLFSVRSWHGYSQHHGDYGTDRLKLADDWLVDQEPVGQAAGPKTVDLLANATRLRC